jgi:hypothetical protein
MNCKKHSYEKKYWCDSIQELCPEYNVGISHCPKGYNRGDCGYEVEVKVCEFCYKTLFPKDKK